ncbi:hypothetical protein ZIOFF_001684 [Zingiber officinale]|uniref:RRM domain-containing protein n=1 Tax=Zingiber officinale TaxID=94328 RepID=A0A8J5LYN4_ZINOF|nr:hypothetical protein ZIOFF_001684 [Zingiber officinale]
MSEVDEYRCFVGRLSWSTTDGSLKEAFQKFGHLTKAKIVLDKFSSRSRGFGFVTFDAEDALQLPELFIQKMSEVDEYRCFVGRLSWSTTDGSLKEAFQKFGHLTKAKIVLDKFSSRSRGFGFVTFDAEDALQLPEL